MLFYCAADTATHRVSFHGRLQNNLIDFNGRLHTFTRDIYNQGGAFDAAAGVFTAPVTGTYYFIGVAGTQGTDKYVSMYMVKNGATLARAATMQYSNYDTMGSCTGILHLAVGDQVWLHGFGTTSFYYFETTTFSGFLISADN